MEGKNVDDVPYFKGPLKPAEQHWFWSCLLQHADTGVITIQRDLWKEYLLKWVFSCIWRGSVPLDVVRLNRALWPAFSAGLRLQPWRSGDQRQGLIFTGDRLVQFLKEDSGQAAGSFSWGQTSCMSLGVFNKNILKKWPSFSTKFASFSTKWWYQEQSLSKQRTTRKKIIPF